jgi:hypothetical protein
MTKVLGIDIGAKFVVAFSLESLPVGISFEDYYRRNAKLAISKIRMDNQKEGSSIKLQDAIELFRESKPDVIVMEPTGVWYSRLWAKLASQLDIEVKWIGHSDLSHNRGAYGFKDKDDRKDAFCLALSYFHPDFNHRNKWLNWKAGLIADVNDRVLELESLAVTTKIYTQQLRQRLKYEFPECANRAISDQRTKDGFTAWVGWLAGIHKSNHIRNPYLKSIAVELGIEISQYTRDHAASLAGNQIRETALKSDLSQLLADVTFDRYRPILENFGFSTKMQGVILSQIYPVEKFLLDGKPFIERWEDDRRKYKKNRSLKAFQLSLGMGKKLIESGGSSVKVYSGSSFARTKLYTWIMKYVVPVKMTESWVVTELDRRTLSVPKPAPTVAQLRTRWQETTGSNADRHKAGAAMAMTLAYRVTRLLYDELSKEFTA